MTREETKKCIEIMQAYVDGADIEYKSNLGVGWNNDAPPQWDWYDVEYRIKKKKKDLNEMIDKTFVNMNSEGTGTMYFWELREVLKEIVKRLPSE
jgi:hypothetical protein